MTTAVQVPGARTGLAGALTLTASAAPRPAVLVLPAVAGLNDYVLRVGRKLAAAGFVAFALDYYDSAGAPRLESPEQIKAAVAGLDDRRIVADALAAAGYLTRDPSVIAGHVGLLGFCVGGSLALLTAAAGDEMFRGVATYYGPIRYASPTDPRPTSPLEVLNDMSCPLVAHYGDEDHLIPVDDILELRKRTTGRPSEIYIYPGAGHAFDEDHRPTVHRPVAAADAWGRTMAFFDYHLPR